MIMAATEESFDSILAGTWNEDSAAAIEQLCIGDFKPTPAFHEVKFRFSQAPNVGDVGPFKFDFEYFRGTRETWGPIKHMVYLESDTTAYLSVRVFK